MWDKENYGDRTINTQDFRRQNISIDITFKIKKINVEWKTRGRNREMGVKKLLAENIQYN